MPIRPGEISTDELSADEVTFARAADALRVEDDGLGYVDAVWLARWRRYIGPQVLPLDIQPIGSSGLSDRYEVR